MSTRLANRLIAESETPAFSVLPANGKSGIVIACEHASNRIPASLNMLGLDQETAASHAAWDPGAKELAEHLSRLLDAMLIYANYSRLVFDVNRPPSSADAFREQSESYRIPGNQNLSEPNKQIRSDAIYAPFHDGLASLLAKENPSALVTIHTFTPEYFGKPRDTELGILHDEDDRLANVMLDLASSFTQLKTERNQPYGPRDGVTHTLKRHALPLGLPNVMIEIRNDLVETAAEQLAVAEELAGLITAGLSRLEASDAA